VPWNPDLYPRLIPHCRAAGARRSVRAAVRARAGSGFTLLELMVAVAIIAILTAIALPAYNTYVLRSKLTEAHNALSNFYVQMEQYFQDNRNFGAGACGVQSPAAPALKYFNFSCRLDNANNFTATVEGVPDQGTGGFQFTIDQSNNRGTRSVPPGWALPAKDCWVTNRGGVCS